MPRGPISDEPLKLFLNPKKTRKAIALQDEIDALLKTATDNAAESLRLDRQNRFEAIRSEQRAAWIAWKTASEAAADEHTGLGEDPDDPGEEPEIMGADGITAQVEKELPAVSVPQPSEVAAKIDELNLLIADYYKDRLELQVEGVQPVLVRTYMNEIDAEMRQPLQARLPDDQRLEYRAQRESGELLAGSIIEVYNPKTGVREDFSKKRMSWPSALQLLKMLPQTEVNKLLAAANIYTNAAVLLDLKTDAGFPGGRIEPPEEPPVGAGNTNGEVLE